MEKSCEAFFSFWERTHTYDHIKYLKNIRMMQRTGCNFYARVIMYTRKHSFLCIGLFIIGFYIKKYYTQSIFFFILHFLKRQFYVHKYSVRLVYIYTHFHHPHGVLYVCKYVHTTSQHL